MNVTPRFFRCGIRCDYIRGRFNIDSALFCVLFFSLLQLSHANAATRQGDDVFPPPQRDFADYIGESKAYIERHQMQHRSQFSVEINSPFEITAQKDVTYRGRFLLIHGLNDSPFVWNDIAQSLSSLGFDVRAILLEGSGTTPKAMLDVSYRDWLQDARAHLQNWDTDDIPIYLGGFSLGGVLATILALENPSVDGLLLISPAYHSKLNRLLRWSWLYQKFKPWVFGGMIIEDNPAKYNSIPINSVTQYFNTTRYLKHRWRRRKLQIPVVMVATSDDSVIDVDFMRSIYRNRFKHDQKRFILYTNDTSIESKETELHRSSKYLQRRILNQSHQSLVNNISNPLFGESRGVLVCNGNTPDVFFGCLRSSQHWYGAQHTPSPDGIAVARTTYNPDYEFIVNQIDAILRPASE